MRTCFIAAITCLAIAATAQIPPAPGAVLAAGADRPFTGHATGRPLTVAALAIAPGDTVYASDDLRVWRITPDGTMSEEVGPWTISGTPVQALATGADGTLYVASTIRIWRRATDGSVREITVNAGRPFGIQGMAVDRADSLYVIDTMNYQPRVWKITRDGAVIPFAGTGNRNWGQDATAPVRAVDFDLSDPRRIAVDSAGNVYLVNGVWLVRITPDGTLYHLAQAGPLSAVTVDRQGRVYVGQNSYDGLSVFRYIVSGSFYRVAGSGAPAYGKPSFGEGCTSSAPGVQSALLAQFASITDLAADSRGNVYVADWGNQRVRLIAPDGTIRTFAGGAFGSFAGDGGMAVGAQLASPSGLVLAPDGSLYIADRANHRVRKVLPDGGIQTVAGEGAAANDDPACFPSTPNTLDDPAAVALTPSGELLIADAGRKQVLRAVGDGTLIVLADTGAANHGAPTSLAVDSAGQIFVADGAGVERITPAGGMEPACATCGAGPIAVDGSGNLYSGVRRISTSGAVFTGRDSYLTALAVDTAGNSYTSSQSAPLARLDLSCRSNTLIASGPPFVALAVAPNGDVYLADAINNHVWRLPARALPPGFAPLALSPVPVLNSATRVPRTVLKASFGFHFSYDQINDDVAPGESIVIRGTCLAPIVQSDAAAATRVRINGMDAPLLSMSANELEVEVPYEVAGAKSVNVQVEYAGGSANVNVVGVDAAPGIFPHQAGLDSPVAAGSTVTLEITGEGQTSPPGVTGQPASNPPAQPVLPVHVSIDDKEIPAAASEAPGRIGRGQVTFQVPATTAPGQRSLTLTVGTQSTSRTLLVK